jgi:ABC-type multidrug transport system fused ATPase/permease subunit
MNNDGATCYNTTTFTQLVIDYIKENKGLFALYLAFLFVIPVRDIMLPHLMSKLYNKVMNDENVTNMILIICAVVLLIQSGYYLSEFVEIRMMPGIQQFIRKKLTTHLFNKYSTEYEELEIGDVLSRFLKLPFTMYNLLEQIKGAILPSMLVICIAWMYFLYKDFLLGVLLLIITIIFIFMVIGALHSCTNLSTQRDRDYNEVFKQLDDIFRNMLTVLSFNNVDGEINTLDVLHETYAQSTSDTITCVMKRKLFTTPVSLAFIGLLIVRCYLKKQKNQITVGEIIALVVIAFFVKGHMDNVIGNLKEIVNRLGIINYSMELFQQCDFPRTPYQGEAWTKEGFSLQSVNFAYVHDGQTRVVFKDLNLMIMKNEVTMIIGKIGSGKSSLISLLLKYHVPQAGEIFFEGVPYSQLDAKQIRQRIMYIPQNPILFNRTIYENIVYGVKNVSKEDVMAMISKLGLQELIQKFPLGLETNVGKYGSKLSGGQRQIVWILKVILLNPDYVILDEPTSSIDETTKNIIRYLLEYVMKNKTTIMVTHDMVLEKLADRIISIDEGIVTKDVRVK